MILLHLIKADDFKAFYILYVPRILKKNFGVFVVYGFCKSEYFRICATLSNKNYFYIDLTSKESL